MIMVTIVEETSGSRRELFRQPLPWCAWPILQRLAKLAPEIESLLSKTGAIDLTASVSGTPGQHRVRLGLKAVE